MKKHYLTLIQSLKRFEELLAANSQLDEDDTFENESGVFNEPFWIDSRKASI
jgi:hypothetical protein